MTLNGSLLQFCPSTGTTSVWPESTMPPGFSGPMGAICLGLVAGALCFFACTAIKNLFRYDDSLDVFGVHGIGGIIGANGHWLALGQVRCPKSIGVLALGNAFHDDVAISEHPFESLIFTTDR